MTRWFFSLSLLLTFNNFAMESAPLLSSDDSHMIPSDAKEQKPDYDGPDYLTQVPQEILALIVKNVSDDADFECHDGQRIYSIEKLFRAVSALGVVNKKMRAQLPEICMRFIPMLSTDEHYDAIRLNALRWIKHTLKSAHLSIWEIAFYLTKSVELARPEIATSLKAYALTSNQLDAVWGVLDGGGFRFKSAFYADMVNLFEDEPTTLSPDALMEIAIAKEHCELIAYLYKKLNFQWTITTLFCFGQFWTKNIEYLKRQGVFKQITDGDFWVAFMQQLEQDPHIYAGVKQQYDCDMQVADAGLTKILKCLVDEMDCWPLYFHFMKRILLTDEELKQVSRKKRDWYFRFIQDVITVDEKHDNDSIRRRCKNILSYLAEYENTRTDQIYQDLRSCVTALEKAAQN